jgi:hypothetical protein
MSTWVHDPNNAPISVLWTTVWKIGLEMRRGGERENLETNKKIEVG